MKKISRVLLIAVVLTLIVSGCDKSKKDETTTVAETTTVTTEERTTEATEKETTEATTEKKTVEKKTEQETTEATTQATTEELTEERTTEDYSLRNDGYNYSDDASGFVLISDVAPEVKLEIRYYTDYNFVGERIDGYEEPVGILTKEAASALKDVNDELATQGYCLKIYDAYRPQEAVDDFAEWAQDINDTKMKADFYPELSKDVLHSQGYIARHSGHSRGSAVDLTLVDLSTGMDVDMGGTFDYFGELSRADYTGITEEQYANRMILRDAMTAHGFKQYSGEWWHFTLINEPYPSTYFTFPVSSSSVGR